MVDFVEEVLEQEDVLSLASRSNEFSRLISNTELTDSDAHSLPLNEGVRDIFAQLTECRKEDRTVYIVGNGGSAAIASHAVIDFVKACQMRAHALLDPAVTTCLSNDYGYEYIYQTQVERFVNTGDVLIAISSSGQSKNITNAVLAARQKGATVITLSGFKIDNPLRQLGDFNLWLDSHDYGFVEIAHAFILHNLTDRLMASLQKST